MGMEFAELVASERVEDVRQWLERAENNDERRRLANYPDIHGAPCILRARDKEMLQLLLDAAGNPNVQDMHGVTALHLACEKGSAGNVRMLLDYKAVPEIMNDNHEAPLMWAVANDRIEVATILLNLPSIYIPRGAAQMAHERKYDGMFQLLVQAKAELHLSSSSNISVSSDEGLHTGARGLLHAARTGNTVGVDACLETCDPDDDYCGDVALVTAASQGHRDTVSWLLQVKSDVNVSDAMGETALFKAVLGNYHDVVELLLDYRANVYSENVAGQTPLSIAADWGFAWPKSTDAPT